MVGTAAPSGSHCPLMTRKKPVEIEVVEGAGASSRLVLVLKAGTKSGYSGVTPNGKAL